MEHLWCLVSFVILYLFTDFASCKAVSEDLKVREKRNIICSFGLTDIIKEALYSSLEDARVQDPLPLDDAWKGQLHDGTLRGLSTLAVVDDIRVFCDGDDLVVFNTALRMTGAEVRYKWTRKFLGKSLSGSVWTTAREVDFDLEVRMNTTCNLRFKVTNSLVTKVDDFEVGFKGLGVLNPIVRQVLKVMYKIWKEKTAAKIGELLKRALERKLTRVARSLDWIPFF